MEIDTITVARHRDVGAVPIHPRCRQHLHPIDCHALRLVDRGGVAMIDMGVILEVKGDATPVIEHDGHSHPVDILNRAERAVLHAQIALVAEEHNPVAFGEAAVTALDLDRDIIAKRPALAQPVPDIAIELANFVVGVSENDPARIGMTLPIAIPRIDQLGARTVAGVGGVDNRVPA